MATRQEFADWRRHLVTQEIVLYLEEKKKDAIDRLITERGQTIEESGMLKLAVQNYVAGICEFLDLEDLQEVLSDVVPD